VQAKRAEVNGMFQISGDSPSDPIARRPTQEQVEWSCKVAAAQEKLVRAYDLDALAYYYHGAPVKPTSSCRLDLSSDIRC